MFIVWLELESHNSPDNVYSKPSAGGEIHRKDHLCDLQKAAFPSTSCLNSHRYSDVRADRCAACLPVAVDLRIVVAGAEAMGQEHMIPGYLLYQG